MNYISRLLCVLRAVVPTTAILLSGCSSTTTIRSDLTLDPAERASMQLHQQTQAIELTNDGDADVRIVVLDKKKRIISRMLLAAHDVARLDVMPARSIEFTNTSNARAIIRWVLRNDDRIEYTLEMTQVTP